MTEQLRSISRRHALTWTLTSLHLLLARSCMAGTSTPGRSTRVSMVARIPATSLSSSAFTLTRNLVSPSSVLSSPTHMTMSDPVSRAYGRRGARTGRILPLVMHGARKCGERSRFRRFRRRGSAPGRGRPPVRIRSHARKGQRVMLALFRRAAGIAAAQVLERHPPRRNACVHIDRGRVSAERARGASRRL